MAQLIGRVPASNFKNQGKKGWGVRAHNEQTRPCSALRPPWSESTLSESYSYRRQKKRTWGKKRHEKAVVQKCPLLRGHPRIPVWEVPLSYRKRKRPDAISQNKSKRNKETNVYQQGMKGARSLTLERPGEPLSLPEFTRCVKHTKKQAKDQSFPAYSFQLSWSDPSS